jgi:hypothetical protein
MLRHLLPSVLSCLLLPAVWLHAADYHVSPSGNDQADGLTPATAWRGLERASEVTYQPGDRLLLKSGGSWTGQLRPKGSGEQDKPIRLGRYGDGPLPRIAMGEQPGPVVRFENQDFWEVSELEISGGNAAPDAVVGGIHFVATNAGRILRHIVVKDCVIRDLGGSFKEYESCGIWVGVEGWNREYGLTTTFEWVRIENNLVHNNTFHVSEGDAYIIPRSGSPCRAKGVVIPNHGGRDLTGNPVPEHTPPDMGALQSTASVH